jgi:hypothetical protein
VTLLERVQPRIERRRVEIAVEPDREIQEIGPVEADRGGSVDRRDAKLPEALAKLCDRGAKMAFRIDVRT